MTTAERILKIRTALNMRQPAFAKEAGVSKAAVSHWEHGKTRPQRDALLNLKKKLNISPEYVTSGVGEMFITQAQTPHLTADPDEAELLRNWEILMPEDKAEFMQKIRARTDYISAVAARHSSKHTGAAAFGSDLMIHDDDLPERNEFGEFANRQSGDRRRHQEQIENERRSIEEKRKK